jgi:hypothetical protein
MSLVHGFPTPTLIWIDWAVVALGLGIGVGASFELIRLSLKTEKLSKLYTLENVWLVLSGVIHVLEACFPHQNIP